MKRWLPYLALVLIVVGACGGREPVGRAADASGPRAGDRERRALSDVPELVGGRVGCAGRAGSPR